MQDILGIHIASWDKNNTIWRPCAQESHNIKSPIVQRLALELTTASLKLEKVPKPCDTFTSRKKHHSGYV